VIVIVAPQRQDSPGMAEIVECGMVQALVAQAPIEALGKGVLLRLTGIDLMPRDARARLPFQHGSASKFRAVITDDAARAVFPRHLAG
jgi:hypothetical protein